MIDLWVKLIFLHQLLVLENLISLDGILSVKLLELLLLEISPRHVLESLLLHLAIQSLRDLPLSIEHTEVASQPQKSAVVESGARNPSKQEESSERNGS